MILDKIREIADSIINIERTIGFNLFKKYIFLAVLVVALFNFKYIATESVSFFVEIYNEIHHERMNLRDEYMTELTPLLIELRIKSGADRVLYFEFHNSEINFGGVPFKFFDLMTGNFGYNVPPVRCSDYKDINSGMYINFFNDLRRQGRLICRNHSDYMFRDKYAGLHGRIYNTDGSSAQIFIDIPGSKQSMGFIVLEWIDDTKMNVEYDTKIINRISDLCDYYATKCR